MTKPTIALCVIARDNAKEILRLLDSTLGVFDVYCLQDTGSKDSSTIDAWKSWCDRQGKAYKVGQSQMGDKPNEYKYVEINGKKVLGDFGHARQDSFNLAREVKADYAVWADTDDVFVNAQLIPSIVQSMQKENYHIALMTYVYAKSNNNIKPVVQKRERILDLHIAGIWADRVHETYQMNGSVRALDIKEVWLEHERAVSHVSETGRRNNLIMNAQLEEEGLSNFSDKMLHNLAFDCWEHKEYDKAIKYFKIFLKRADRGNEVNYETGLRIAKAYLEGSKLDKAILWALKCIGWLNNRAESYGILAECYDRLGNYADALYYADKVVQIGKPNTTSPVNEYDYSITPLRIKTHAYISMGNLQKAHECMEQVLQLSGDQSSFRELKGLETEMKTIKTIQGIANLIEQYQDNGNIDKLDRVIDSIPLELLDHPTVRKLIAEMSSDYKRKTQRVIFKGSKTIAFYAGEQAITSWDGESDIKQGIGGSEGMCIQLSRELAKLGNKVVVFNNCSESDGKIFYGVQYFDYRKWNPNLKCDVFISLRRPDVFSQTLKAKKQYLWLHDTGYGDLPKVDFTSPDKVIVLSQAHKEVIKQSHLLTDDSMFWITRNGVNPIALKYADDNAKERNPFQIVYASSYDRGLEFLLENWSKIKTEVPEATLKIMYGWNTFDALMNARMNAQEGQYMYQFKQKMLNLIANSTGIQELGRLSQNDTYKVIKESGIWFYPTSFYEISCITAMSAQALGTIPVCTPVGALNETVNDKYGIKLKQDSIVDGLIYYLKNHNELEGKRESMMKWARKAYSMEELGKQWNEFFNKD